MKTISFYFKESFIANMYLVIFALIDLGVLCLDDSLYVLKIILCAIVLLGYLCVTGLMFYKEGESSIKVRRGNDLNREQIIKTGRDYPLNLVEEYKPWKGFLIGFTSCIPLFVCLIIHAIVSPMGELSNGGGVIAAFLYMIVFSFFRAGGQTPILKTDYYYTLIAVPAIVLSIGIGYILGARKAIKDHEKILERSRAIHGDAK